MLEKNEIIQSALRNLKIEELNPMQEASLEQATGRKDVILLSPTGSGKTLAYLLPLLLTLKPNDDSVQVLILVPSRELALQIDSVFKAMGTSWKTCCCYGGHPIAEEKKSILGNHPAIIIGTPGRITDHLSKGNFNPETIETLIIDEFDKSLEFGFHDEMAEIITQLPGLKKRMLLSATDVEEIPEFTGLNRTVKLNFLSDDSEEQESRLKLMKVLSPSKDKIDTLYNLLCSLGSSSSIVFCNHRDAVDRVHKLLEDKKLLAERFHGGMEQPDRERALYKFRNGSCHVLISTDLAARGLDIPEINACADVAVIPSVREGFGMTGVEALASGVPVVGSDVQGIREYVIPGKTGYLCDPYDAHQFADAIEKIVNLPSEERAKMVIACKEKAKEFDVSKSIAAMKNIYQEVLCHDGK